MKILMLGNSYLSLYNQRKELIRVFIDKGYEVYVAFPDASEKDLLIDLGCKFVNIKMSRHGTNPFSDYKIISQYKKIIKQLKPDIILSYTIKPNLYGSIAARKYKVPIICNITGLGVALENQSLVQRITFMLYKYALKKTNHVFAQNQSNMDFLISNKLVNPKIMSLLPGSGVNLDEFQVVAYPDTKEIKFAFISRIMKEKGIDNYLQAASIIKEDFPNTSFYVCGFFEQDYENIIKEYNEKKIIIYKGMLKSISSVYHEIHCLVHPSYYPEGLSNVLLEASACARPIITTNRSGCKEVIDDKVNGFLVKENDTLDLVEKIKTFILLPDEKKKILGENARLKVENQFNRNIVVNKYLTKIDELLK